MVLFELLLVFIHESQEVRLEIRATINPTSNEIRNGAQVHHNGNKIGLFAIVVRIVIHVLNISTSFFYLRS
jgi:hypothetical protein